MIEMIMVVDYNMRFLNTVVMQGYEGFAGSADSVQDKYVSEILV